MLNIHAITYVQTAEDSERRWNGWVFCGVETDLIAFTKK
jgi:hypothetical protein